MHTLANRALIARQEACVRKVIDTVNDLDNVMFEISNEDTGGPANTEWQIHMIDFIRNRPVQRRRGLVYQCARPAINWARSCDAYGMFSEPFRRKETEDDKRQERDELRDGEGWLGRIGWEPTLRGLAPSERIERSAPGNSDRGRSRQ
jgi:hypothetical protein